MKTSPETIAAAFLLFLVLCAEVNSFRRARNISRYEHTVKSQRGVVFLLVLIPVALVTWTLGWVLGQKRICDQRRAAGEHPDCVWTTGTVR